MNRKLPLALGALLCSAALLLLTQFDARAQTSVFINELHYDNDGTDAGEAIEIAGPAGTDLTGWSLVLYNGNGGAPYTTTPSAQRYYRRPAKWLRHAGRQLPQQRHSKWLAGRHCARRRGR